MTARDRGLQGFADLPSMGSLDQHLRPVFAATGPARHLCEQLKGPLCRPEVGQPEFALDTASARVIVLAIVLISLLQFVHLRVRTENKALCKRSCC
jgi:hypothetical protein